MKEIIKSKIKENDNFFYLNNYLNYLEFSNHFIERFEERFLNDLNTKEDWYIFLNGLNNLVKKIINRNKQDKKISWSSKKLFFNGVLKNDKIVLVTCSHITKKFHW